MNDPLAIERLFQRFAVGDRVRAHLAIFNASTGETVPEGAAGTVEQTRVAGCTSLVRVKWDGSTFEGATTSVEHLDREPS